MMYARGAVADLRADFVATGDVTGVVLTIRNPAGILFLTVSNPTELQLDSYQYLWSVPADAALGIWEARWTGTYAGATLAGSEFFEVTLTGLVTFPANVKVLRQHVGDRLLAGMSSDDLFYTDQELQTILVKNLNNVAAATIEGWFIKMAQYAELVDHVESGAERRMRQKFVNAREIYKGLVDKSDKDNKARLLSKGIIGKAINLRKDYHDPLGLGSSHYAFASSGGNVYVRTYPLRRFPAILG